MTARVPFPNGLMRALSECEFLVTAFGDLIRRPPECAPLGRRATSSRSVRSVLWQNRSRHARSVYGSL